MTGASSKVEWVGRERNPVVVIDDLASDYDGLKQAALSLNFAPLADQYYPGIRAIAPDGYFQSVVGPIRSAMAEFYRAERLTLRKCYFSLTTTAIGDLTVEQRLPHYDTTLDNQYAVVHFLCPEVFGGTGFFAHRQTGFETIGVARRERYLESLDQELAQHGPPPPSYPIEDSPIFERLTTIAARANRAVIFRGNMLHSGAVPALAPLSSDPMQGRLTVVTFLSGA